MSKDKFQKGLVHVYTGDGKGKTTAALGLALRASGHDLNVHMIQFMKGDINYGELRAVMHLPNFTIVQFGRASFVDRENPSEEDKALAEKALEHAREVVNKGEVDILILDELNVAVDFKLIEVEDVLSLIESKPEHMEMVITGRNAHEKIIERGDYVTDMRSVKHPFEEGILGRWAIEH
ncbi:MAG: cob(I)yrinic acid a,c-diamide adenosyltransferase [Thermoplasmata archaeon]|nr:MAG: cob(I)yrinic acid a,c-diamide adenosyltransferase [Thermoplasmata archaeon]